MAERKQIAMSTNPAALRRSVRWSSWLTRISGAVLLAMPVLWGFSVFTGRQLIAVSVSAVLGLLVSSSVWRMSAEQLRKLGRG